MYFIVYQKKTGEKMGNLFLVRYPEKPVRIPEKGKISIGRAENNIIVLTELRASRKHAIIEWIQPQQTYAIIDLGSSNGTYLNGTKLATNHPRHLNDWDKIRIASAVFTVRIVDDPSLIINEFKELRNRVQCEVTEVITLSDVWATENQTGFAGELAHLCPVELFQMIETGNKSGILTLKTAGGEGAFTITGGRIVTAHFDEKKAEEAVYEALKHNQGKFSFNPQEIAVSRPEITASITALLMEGCRLLDEASVADARLDSIM